MMIHFWGRVKVSDARNDPFGCAASEGGAPFVAPPPPDPAAPAGTRCAPPAGPDPGGPASLCPPFFPRRGYPGGAKLVSGRPPSCGRSAGPSRCGRCRLDPPGGEWRDAGHLRARSVLRAEVRVLRFLLRRRRGGRGARPVPRARRTGDGPDRPFVPRGGGCPRGYRVLRRGNADGPRAGPPPPAAPFRSRPPFGP